MTDGSDSSHSTTPKEGKEKKAREMTAAAATDKAINHSVTAPLHRRLLLYYIHTSTPQYARLRFPSLPLSMPRELQYMAAAAAAFSSASSMSSSSSSSSSSAQWLVQ